MDYARVPPPCIMDGRRSVIVNGRVYRTVAKSVQRSALQAGFAQTGAQAGISTHVFCLGVHIGKMSVEFYTGSV